MIAKSRFDILAALTNLGRAATLDEIRNLCPDMAAGTVQTATGDCKRQGLVEKTTAGFMVTAAGREIVEGGFAGRVVARGAERAARTSGSPAPAAAEQTMADRAVELLREISANRDALVGDDWVHFAREVAIIVGCAQGPKLADRVAFLGSAKDEITDRSYADAFSRLSTPAAVADALGVSLTTARRAADKLAAAVVDGLEKAADVG